MDFDCRLGTLVTSYTTHLFDPHISSEPLTDMNITIIIIIFIIIIPIITVTNICLIGLLINSACGGNNSILQMVKVTTIVIIMTKVMVTLVTFGIDNFSLRIGMFDTTGKT